MRILLILILIAAAYVVYQAQTRGCKYDATLINCVFRTGERPAAEMPAPAVAPEPAAPETPAPAP